MDLLRAIIDCSIGHCMEKMAKKMPHFTEQNRPEKVKEIYRALKRDHPNMPAEVKARIASRKGSPDPEKRKPGPPYKGKLHYKRSKGRYVKKSEEILSGQANWPSKFILGYILASIY